MLVEKNTFGQALFWTSAPSSVPRAPAPSGVTGRQLAVEKPGVEMWAPDGGALAVDWTCQPPSPRVETPVGSASAWMGVRMPANAAQSTVASRRESRLRGGMRARPLRSGTAHEAPGSQPNY